MTDSPKNYENSQEEDADSYNSETMDAKKAEKDAAEKAHNFSEKGKKMAAALGEIVLMKYFFPETKDRKRQSQMKNLFNLDM
jgi:hypothetical protein